MPVTTSWRSFASKHLAASSSGGCISCGAKRTLLSRRVERRFAFGAEEKEKFRALMRLQEKFTGCRVVSHCPMCNHFQLWLEVTPMANSGLSDETLLKQLSAIYSEAFVAAVTKGVIWSLRDLRKGRV